MSHAAYSSLFDEILLNGKILDSATPPGVLNNFTTIYSDLAGITGSIASLQAQINTDNTDNLALHAAVASLQTQINTDNTDNLALHAGLSSLTNDLNTTNATVSTLSASLDTTNASIRSDMTSLIDATNASLTSSLDTTNATVSTLSASLDTTNISIRSDMTSLIDATNASLDATNATVSTLSASLDTTNTSIRSDMTSLIDATNATVSTLSSSLDTTNTSIRSDMTSLIDATNASLDATNTTVSTLSSSLDATNTTVSTLSSSLDTTNATVSTLSSSLDTTNTSIRSDMTSLIDATNASLDATNTTVSTLSTSLDTTNASIRSDMTDLINVTKTDLTDITTSLQDITTQTSATVAQHASDIVGLKAYDWSTHDATQNVSYAGHNITNVNSLTCSTLNYTTLNPAPVVFANTYYVDKAGSDSNPGSALFPFLTIQKAIDTCETTWNGTAKEIRVSFGTYDQQLTFKKARVQLTAVGSRYTNTACSITKNILVQVAGSVDMFNSQIAINGFQIVGKVLDTSTSTHTLVLMNCYIYANENAVSQTCSVDNRTYMENCTVQAGNTTGTQALLNFASGGVSLISVSITQKSTQSCIILSGTAYLNNCVLSTFTNDNSGATLLPLMQITTSSIAPQVVANCGFIFSSDTIKEHTVTQCNNVGIYMSWGAGSTVGGVIPLTLITDTFLLRGTVDGNLIVDASNNYYYLFHANCYTGHSNLSGQAHLMCGTFNVNKFPLCPAS